MRGTPTVPFSALFADTVQTHGVPWAWGHYSKHGMTQREFRIWLKSIW